MTKVYIIGALKNLEIPKIGIAIRNLGFDAFDDWWSASEDADDWWQAHERQKNRSYRDALYGHHATCVFEFDHKHLDAADAGVLVMPCGRSGHLEAGYLAGQKKPVFILFEGEPDKYDVMYRLLTRNIKTLGGVYFNLNELLEGIDKHFTGNRA